MDGRGWVLGAEGSGDEGRRARAEHVIGSVGVGALFVQPPGVARRADFATNGEFPSSDHDLDVADVVLVGCTDPKLQQGGR